MISFFGEKNDFGVVRKNSGFPGIEFQNFDLQVENHFFSPNKNSFYRGIRQPMLNSVYSEWCSLEGDVLGVRNQISVLNRFPVEVSKQVSTSIVASIASSTVDLVIDKEVKFSEEVLCYALSLSFTDEAAVHTVKNSVNIYCEWLKVLTEPNDKIPLPIRKNPEPHVRRMLDHLQNLFVPRQDRRFQDNQEKFCRKVLDTVVRVVRHANLDPSTWEVVLMFLLRISDTLLAPPLITGHLADSLCSGLVKTLFEVWFIACAHSFPTPTFWKTLSDFVQGWRHHYPVVDWWSRFSSILADRVIQTTQGPGYPRIYINEDDQALIMPLDEETATQAWYRFLRVISNPVELTDPGKVARQQKFVQMAKLSRGKEDMLNAINHPCLQHLPQIFLRTMQGVSQLVDGFLGIQNRPELKNFKRRDDSTPSGSSIPPSTPLSHSPPSNRRGKHSNLSRRSSNLHFPEPPKSIMGSEATNDGPSNTSSKSRSSKDKLARIESSQYMGSSSVPQLLPSEPSAFLEQRRTDHFDSIPRTRPYVNSVLHLFGKWLFEAALGAPADTDTMSQARSVSMSDPSWHSDIPSATLDDIEAGNEGGRAEALGCLSRILSTVRTDEKVIPAYLARAYLALSHGLLEDCPPTRAAILLFGLDFFRIDLPGVTCLLPLFISVLEQILPDQQMARYHPIVNLGELRYSAVQLLLSTLPIPLHYGSAEISLLPSVEIGITKESFFRFADFRDRQAKLLFDEIDTDSDSTNLQIAIAGLQQLLIDTINDYQNAQQAMNDTTCDTRSEHSDSTVRSYDIHRDTTFDSLNTAPGLLLSSIRKLTGKLDSWATSATRNTSVVLSAFEVLR